MPQLTNSVFVSVTLFALFIVGGCGGPAYEGPKRFAVSGQVQFNNEPLNEGVINLLPLDPDGRSAGGEIQNGRYEIEEPQGPTAGRFRVEILGYKTVRESVDPDFGPQVEQIVPTRYNITSTLVVEIGGSGDNVHDFNLEK
jgi:hypothetical protein